MVQLSLHPDHVTILPLDFQIDHGLKKKANEMVEEADIYSLVE